MTFADAFHALFPNWRTRAPVESGAIPDEEREARRLSESERQRLERISKLPR